MVEPEQRGLQMRHSGGGTRNDLESKEGSVVCWFYGPAALTRWLCAFYTELCLNSLKRKDLLYMDNLMVSVFIPPLCQLRGATAASGGGCFQQEHLKMSEKCYRQ